MHAFAKSKGIPVNAGDENIEFQFKFKTNLDIPEYVGGSSTDSTRAFLNKNMNDVDGELLFYENSKVVRTLVIEDGIIRSKFCKDSDCDDHYSQRYDCSYDGLQDCTQHAIYVEMNMFEQLICAAEGLGCILTEMLSCSFDNC